MNTPFCLLVRGIVVASAITRSFAVTETWDGNLPNGGAGDSNISNGLNWADNTAPVSSLTDTHLVFAGGVKLSPIVNVALSARSITFNNTAGAFALVGGTLSVGEEGIVNNDTQNMSFLNPVSFSGASKPAINAADGGLTFASVVVLPVDELTVTGVFPTTFTAITGTSSLHKEGTGTMTWSPGGAVGYDASVTGGALNTTADGTTDVCNATSVIGIGGTGILNINENLVLDGALLTRSSGSALNVATGKTLTLKNGADANITGAFAGAAGFEVSGAGSTLTTTGNFTLHGGGTLAVQDGGSVASGAGVIQIGESGGTGTATVTVDGTGTSFSGGDLRLGQNQRQGDVTFSGNATGSFGILHIASAGPNNSHGTLNIQAGAAVTGTGLWVGAILAECVATVNVSGTGSSLTISGAGIGTIGALDESTALVNVHTGGTVTSGTGTTTVRSTGHLDIGAGGTWHSKGDLTLDRGRLTRASTGTFNLDAGKTLLIEAGADADFTGTYALTNGARISLTGAGSSLTVSSTLSLSGGSTLTAAADAGVATAFGTLNVGNAPGGASLTMDGTGSTVNAFFLNVGTGAPGNTGQAVFRNSSTGTCSSLTAAANGANGSISIESGSSVTSNTLTLGTSTSGGTGLVTVTGAGSALTLNNVATIGATSAGIGTLAVQAGGTFTGGTDQTITVRPTGTLSITGGTLNANGNLTVDGGLFTRDAAGVFTLANGKSFIVQNGGDATFTGSYTALLNAVFMVTGAGSTLSTTTQLVLADNSSATVSAGGSLSAGSSSIGLAGLFNSPGTVTVDGGGSSFSTTVSAVVGGSGHLILSNAATGTFPTLTLEDDGQADIESGAIVNATTLRMSQAQAGGIGGPSPTTLNVSGGGRLTVSGTAAIAAVNSPDATLNVSGGGTLDFTSGPVSVANPGLLHLQTGGTLTGPADFTGNGRITLGGFYVPGGANQTTSVSLQPATTFASTGTTILEIGGLTAGTQHDQLVFTSAAATQVTWAGTLTVSLINGFVPQAGHSFRLLDFDPARDSGTFATLNLPVLAAGLAWQSDTLYTDGTLRIISTAGITFAQWAATVLGDPAATPAGDHDRDGLPNAVEFALALTTPAITLHAYPDGTRLRVQFQRPLDRTGVTLKVQAASSLTDWTDLAVSVNSAPFTGPGFVSENRSHPLNEPGPVEVRDILTASTAPRRQMRLLITLSP